LDELKSEESEEFEDSRSQFDSSEDDEEEEKQILQTMRHFIRLEIEKKCIAFCESEPELLRIKEKDEAEQALKEEQLN